MAEVAVESLTFRTLASGDGWSVSDVVCVAGPQDRPFEERYAETSIEVVVSGTFEYRCDYGCDLMTPGSILLGNSGECFRCAHEHGVGDRCVSFAYPPEFFERIIGDAGALSPRFQSSRLPPMRELSDVTAKASALLRRDIDRLACAELSVQLATRAMRVEAGLAASRVGAPASSLARVTDVVRMMEQQSDLPHDLDDLSRVARLSPYHFLRTFQDLTGATPHQFLLRLRLRHAAIRLSTEKTKIIDVALACGFGDISNFNRMFRAEFGVSPRAYRKKL